MRVPRGAPEEQGMLLRHLVALAAVVLVIGAPIGAVAGPGKDAPLSVAAPSISGDAVVGQTLSASTGVWSGKALKYGYAWSRCDSGGSSCVAVGGASATYLLGSGDVGATFRVSVTATNRSGSVAATSSASAVVTAPVSSPAPPPPPVDATAPTVPPNLAAAPGASSIDLSWGASTDNVGVAGYRVYQGTALATTTTTRSYTLAGLTCGTTVGVSVTAFDAAGNVSPAATISSATSACSDPSGEAMPTGDLPGWHQIFTDDFTKDVPLGSFPSAVASKWKPYPYPWKDTSKNGTYWPEKGISQHGGLMDLWLHTETVNGVTYHVSEAPQPILPIATRGQLYGRYVIRFRSDPVPGYKTAWLLWPDSGLRSDGEIDFPEGSLDGSMYAYMHHQGATSGSDQDAYPTGVGYSSWHTAVIEWLPTRCTFILDGKVIGNSTTRIPATPMHWVIQTETQLSGGAPTNDAAGHVYIDWVAVYSRA
jgi:hypothetical protein